MKFRKEQKGFTLLEVLIAMSILTSIVLAVTTMLRNSLDIKFALAEKNTVTQKINRILHKMSYDISHTFFLHQVDVLRGGEKGRTFFSIEKGTDSDSIKFTYNAHSATHVNAHESSLSYVVYKLEESKKYPGRKHLYRGELPRPPSSFKEDPPMKIFADNVYSVRFFPWSGDSWSKDKWDSTGGATRGKIPHMILIEVSVWVDPPKEDETRDKESDNATERYATIVYLENSLNFEELKTPGKSFKI